VSRAFDVTGPLPTGVTVLEASAGTGKTYTIAGLAARYVADGKPLEQLLIVTFTRMATAELRDRVRERLVNVEYGLERALAGETTTAADPVLELLTTGDAETLETRRQRMADAIADFDKATIVTTHGFCQEVLGGLGIAGDLEPGITFVEDLSDLVSEVVDDLYLRRFHNQERPDFDRAQALQIAKEAVNNPDAPIEPTQADGTPAMRARLADAVRRELDRRKRARGVMTYDDLLTRLDHALKTTGGTRVAQRLRDRYSVVLVDEFQDTDPTQWDIMRRAFGDGDTTLVLIGDPKQAIYAFRGADVYAYLDAARTAGQRADLDTNWRSDQGLIDAYDALFGGAQLGHEGIVYRPVKAAPPNQQPRLTGAPDSAPVRIRVVPRLQAGTTRTGFATTDGARRHIAQDLANDLVALLDSQACIEARTKTGEPRDPRRIEPGDVAVLVRRRLDAELIRQALDDAGIPAVFNGAGSVFATPPADDWLKLLEAIERPTSDARMRAAALTDFLGWTPQQVAGATEDAWEDVRQRLHEWANVLRVSGVASLTETITLDQRLPERLLQWADGERRLTDLRHIAQLLHAAAMEEDMGVAALTGWLRRRIKESADEGDEERSRRLESDAQAVQVLTIHRSKGLEFPVVYLPYLWHPSWITDKPVPVAYHDGDVRKVDVGLEGRGYREHKAKHTAEQRGEDLRLAYVALTRAQHQAVVWWAGTRDAPNSPLGRLVFARQPDGSVAENGPPTPDDEVAVARFEELAARAPGCVSVQRAEASRPARWRGLRPEPAQLDVAIFDRTLDRGWRRTSYSDITAAAHEAWVASEPEEPVLDDEPSPAVTAAPLDDSHAPLKALPSLWAELPTGASVGTLVHLVMEEADFAARDLAAELDAQVGRAQARRFTDVGERARVVQALQATIETPILGDLRLADIGRRDRLDELRFELPLVGGDTPTGRLAPAMIGAVLREHLAPDDPLAGYAERLDDTALRQNVRGYLTGSIDLVVRTPDGRFAIADYKTNWLAPPGEELTLWHHRPAALRHEMERSHYGLQALLYTVALHRYLRWRLPGYRPEQHLGGVRYLFVRGMAGADTPVVDGHPTGVFAWEPTAPLVQALSDVLDRGAQR
jgi:exodeoxyribonuclease V beta subunit